MATTIPRPARPSLSPPTGPLPSLPVPKSRDNAANGKRDDDPNQMLTSLRPPASVRAASSSLPTRPQLKAHSTSVSSIPTVSTIANESASIATPARTLRKTISIGAFPQPPRGLNRTNHPPSPLSASATPMQFTPSAGPKAIPQRRSSMQPKTPKGARRTSSIKSPLTPSSLLHANGDAKSISSSGFLSLPSPPGSRTSSAQGSYATSATTFEDLDDDARGRDGATPDNKSGADRQSAHKDSNKGNVIVSVRVRPDVGGGDHTKTELEWMVDGRKSLISYRGKEGGEYYYGMPFCYAYSG
jgi:centromeric protein E